MRVRDAAHADCAWHHPAGDRPGLIGGLMAAIRLFGGGRNGQRRNGPSSHDARFDAAGAAPRTRCRRPYRPRRLVAADAGPRARTAALVPARHPALDQHARNPARRLRAARRPGRRPAPGQRARQPARTGRRCRAGRRRNPARPDRHRRRAQPPRGSRAGDRHAARTRARLTRRARPRLPGTAQRSTARHQRDHRRAHRRGRRERLPARRPGRAPLRAR